MKNIFLTIFLLIATNNVFSSTVRVVEGSLSINPFRIEKLDTTAAFIESYTRYYIISDILTNLLPLTDCIDGRYEIVEDMESQDMYLLTKILECGIEKTQEN